MEDAACYDYQLKPIHHPPLSDAHQRYISPTTGKCRPLVVQCASPNPQNPEEVEISGGPSWIIRLSTLLVERPPWGSVENVLLWFGRWLLLVLCLLYPFTEPTYDGKYKSYISKFYGQLWAARSPKEYELRKDMLRAGGMTWASTPEEEAVQVRKITHASIPRQLMIYNSESSEWMPCTDEETIKDTKYLAVSYRLADFNYDATALQYEIEMACSQLGIYGYWFDQVCIGKSQEEINSDLYRMSDVYRGADKTLILIAGPDEKIGWQSWGGRVWTLPEALLSRELLCKVGSAPIQSISLRQVANKAYSDADIEMAIIDGFSGKDPLSRLERLSLLKAAIWRRSGGASSSYPAERVYALMGFFEHRIMPHPEESVLKALARLSMINDSDRFVERMVNLLPTNDKGNERQACWYGDDDAYGANLWNIEPAVQVTGISISEALVLDGCRATAIRWKSFPKVAHALKKGIRRNIARYSTTAITYVIGIGLFIMIIFSQVDSSLTTGAIIFGIGMILSLASPWLIKYAHSGRVVLAQPWLIGVKGFYTPEELTRRLYGFPNANPNIPRVTYSPTGSIFSRPSKGKFRQGDAQSSSAAARNATNVYTLVDTFSNTIYHFTAQRPPTVCVYTGREGGLGRFVLCSENCTKNELHKETVLRMPDHIGDHMPRCDWIAIG